jgi:hypothetical protein
LLVSRELIAYEYGDMLVVLPSISLFQRNNKLFIFRFIQFVYIEISDWRRMENCNNEKFYTESFTLRQIDQIKEGDKGKHVSCTGRDVLTEF